MNNLKVLTNISGSVISESIANRFNEGFSAPDLIDTCKYEWQFNVI